MTDPALITALATLITAIATLVRTLQSARKLNQTHANTEQIKEQTNGTLHELQAKVVELANTQESQSK
jgi:uncharacterized protein YoxC